MGAFPWFLLLGAGCKSRHVANDGGHVGGTIELHTAQAAAVRLQHAIDTYNNQDNNEEKTKQQQQKTKQQLERHSHQLHTNPYRSCHTLA
jgi:hypothetical protein